MPLADRLSRRLLGLCMLAGLLTGIVPPGIHAVVSHQQLRARAAAHARSLAGALGVLAARQPRLWRYNAGKVLLAASRHPGLDELGALSVRDCAGRELFSGARLGVPPDHPLGPFEQAPIPAFGTAAGYVRVAMDAGRSREQLLAVSLASVLIGLLLATGLYLVPARGISRRAEEERRRRLAERVIAAQESERRRIARDLHDGLGQHLTAARVALDGGDTELARACAEDALAELRQAVFELRPRELDERGTAAAIAAAVERFERRHGVAAAFRHEGADIADGQRGAALLRIAQEALTNVARHARASEVGVVLAVDAKRASLVVHDDGRGFETGAGNTGTGLSSMAERAHLLGGEITVRAGGDGTEVRVWVPLAQCGERR